MALGAGSQALGFSRTSVHVHPEASASSGSGPRFQPWALLAAPGGMCTHCSAWLHSGCLAQDPGILAHTDLIRKGGETDWVKRTAATWKP